MRVVALAGCLSLVAGGGSRDLPGRTDDYRGHVRHVFERDGRRCFVVEPRSPAPGRPWVWRAEFFDAFPAFDLAMLAKGWWLVYLDVQNLYGGPEAMRRFDALYDFLTGEHGFSKRPVLEGLSRGGLFVFNWAARRPGSVGAVYGDGAVCDFRSWPGGKGRGPGSRADWERLLKVYGFGSEEEAMAYRLNPVDNLEPLARAGIPVVLVTGDADEVVPHDENSMVVKERYEKLGGTVRVFVKPGGRHHPHGLPDPAPVVEFVLEKALR